MYAFINKMNDARMVKREWTQLWFRSSYVTCGKYFASLSFQLFSAKIKRRLAMFHLRLFPIIKCHDLKYLQFDISTQVP